MDDTNKSYKLLFSILALVFNVLTAAFAYSFLGPILREMGLSQSMRFWCGLPIMLSPVFTAGVVFALWKKGKAAENNE